MKQIGSIAKRHEETEIEWKIPEFFSVCEAVSEFESPRFSFRNCHWKMQLFPRSTSKPGFITLYLETLSNLAFYYEYNFGLKKVDGSVENLDSGIYKTGWIDPCYFILSEIQQKKSELTIAGELSILCTIKHKTNHSDQTKLSNALKLRKLIKLETLSENFKNLFLNKESCDTTLYVMDKEYKAHKTVLMARSNVFASMFLHETSEKQTGVITISDCEPESFEQFLEFLYTGTLENPSGRSALHLYETSDKYDVQELKTFCSEFLMEYMTVKILCDTVVMADKYDDTKLLSAAQCFFNKNLKDVFESSEWDCLLTNNRRLAKRMLIEMSEMKA